MCTRAAIFIHILHKKFICVSFSCSMSFGFARMWVTIALGSSHAHMQRKKKRVKRVPFRCNVEDSLVPRCVQDNTLCTQNSRMCRTLNSEQRTTTKRVDVDISIQTRKRERERKSLVNTQRQIITSFSQSDMKLWRSFFPLQLIYCQAIFTTLRKNWNYAVD